MGEEFGLALGDVRELGFECFENAGMQRPARLAQQHGVSGVLHERVLEHVGGVRSLALPEEKPRGDEPVDQPRQF